MKVWRTLLAGSLSLALLVGCAGCDFGGPKKPDNTDDDKFWNEGKPLEDNSGMTYDRYELKTYLYPYWEGNTVYNETLWFAGERSAPLMYKPDRILKVTSYDLTTEYTEGVDFTVDGKNIVLTEQSGIPYMSEEDYIKPTTNGQLAVPKTDDFGHSLGYVYANEGSDIISRQVVVTYTHSERGEWVEPVLQKDKISRTLAKLEAGEKVKMVFYGDSITVGANSSEFVKYAPYAESYANMVKSYFERRYPDAEIEMKNNAVGGTDSNWANDLACASPSLNAMDGGQHFDTRVAKENPDLLFIAFGMNDSSFAPFNYEANIRSVVDRAQQANPNVEIVLVSGMIANPGTAFHNKNYKLYEASLATVASEFGHVAVARVWTNVNTVYETLGKRFQDCTANNANHPNDFMMRVYAQTILQTLFGDGYVNAIEEAPATPPGGEDVGGGGEGGSTQDPGGTQNPQNFWNAGKPLADNSGKVYDKYDINTYLYPYWEGNTVYNETLWFAGERTAPLMYTPDQVLKVTSYDLKTVYQEGVDYTVQGKNIVLTENSRIPYMDPSTYYKKSGTNGGILVPKSDTLGQFLGNVYANEGSDISLRQVAVTDTHSDRGVWQEPEVQTAKLSRVFNKLEHGQNVKIVFYGDSITVGANASNFVNCGPHAESYADMVTSYFKKIYPGANITMKNNAVGGTDSNWANDGKMNILDFDNLDGGNHFTARVANENPDLLFVAFGMNDTAMGSTAYEANIRSVVQRAKAANPNVDIVLISCMPANPGTVFNNNKNYFAYEESLAKIAKDNDHVAVARVWTNVNTVYETLGKRFQDCTANNANHPNDFLMRLYAQTILETLFGDSYYINGLKPEI